MKKDFEDFCDFLRDEADDMDAKGKPNEASDQVAGGHALGAQVGSPLEYVASLFRRHVAAVTPTLNEDEGTAPRRNSSLHQKHEGVAVVCPRPPG